MGDESHLVEAVRRGDPRAFEDLLRAYQHRVFGVALRMLGNRAEAEEVAQEVFLRVHKAIDDFRGEAKLSTWLYAIASRLCLNRLASGERRAVREGEETLTRLASGRPGPGDELERSELEAALHRAIAELPEERRIVVVLRDLKGSRTRRSPRRSSWSWERSGRDCIGRGWTSRRSSNASCHDLSRRARALLRAHRRGAGRQ